MNNLTDKEKKRILATADIIEHGDLAVLKKLIEFQDILDNYVAVNPVIDLQPAMKELQVYCENCISEIKNGMSHQYSTTSAELIRLEDTINQAIGSSSEDQKLQSKELSNFISSEISRISSIIQKLPTLPDLSYLDIKLRELETKIPVLKDTILDTPEEIRDKLEKLKDEERLDISAIKGLDKNNVSLSDAIINRAIGIVDQRTSYLINKVSNLQTQIDAVGTGGGLNIADPISGLINGSNTVFVFAVAPKYLSIDNTNKFVTENYTIAGTTVTITDGSPPVNSIKGIS